MMDQWANWVLDAAMGWPPCFCPIEGDIDGDYKIVVGMNFFGVPPGKIVAVIHESQEAADAFYAAHKTEIDAMLAESRQEQASRDTPSSPEETEASKGAAQ